MLVCWLGAGFPVALCKSKGFKFESKTRQPKPPIFRICLTVLKLYFPLVGFKGNRFHYRTVSNETHLGHPLAPSSRFRISSMASGGGGGGFNISSWPNRAPGVHCLFFFARFFDGLLACLFACWLARLLAGLLPCFFDGLLDCLPSRLPAQLRVWVK